MMPEPSTEFDLRQELLAAFEGEYREHLAAIRARLDAGAVSGNALRDVFRRVHSLKGAARAVELPGIEQIAHVLETLLHGSVETGRALPSEDEAALRRGLDSIETAMYGQPPAPGAQPSTEPAVAQAAPAAEPPASDPGSRVSVHEIDRLVESVQAASDAMLGQEHGRQWLLDHQAELRKLLSLYDRNDGGRQDDAVSLGLRALLRSTAARLHEGRYEDWQREHLVSALRAQVERVALVSADSVFGPMAAMARELGRAQNQEIDVRLHGMALLADRPVLQALRDPVIQLLRNAVGHGLGQYGRDGAAGRNGPAALSLSVSMRAGRLLVEVADNGVGPDLKSIAARGRERGLLAQDAPLPDEASLLALAFEPGFSTAAEVDRLSGRGMGLSIVAEAAARLGGDVSMHPRRDAEGAVRGTVLCMSVPLAARRQALLLVEAGGHLLALPCEAVSRLSLLPWRQIERAGPVWRARIEAGRTLAVRPLAALLGVASAPREDGQVPLVVLRGLPDRNRAGETAAVAETGLLVDRLREVSTLVVRVPAIVGVDRRRVAGVALIAGNRPVLVLDPDGLRDDDPAVPLATSATTPGGGEATDAAAARSTRRRPTILVVDDSITTRTLEKTILQAQGYGVLVAVDGLEALDVLRAADQEIDIVVADVEMPRLDGFGLVAAMRADPRLKATPLVLMTSRNSEEDIRRGLDLGANAYLTKQEFEQGMLLTVIGQLLP